MSNTPERYKSRAYNAGYAAAKRVYFDKVKSQKFWDEVVHDNGPEGVEYARQTLVCLQSALKEMGKQDVTEKK